MTGNETTRRRLLAATAGVGASLLAGCSVLSGGEGDPENDVDPGSVGEYRQFQGNASNRANVPSGSIDDDGEELWRFQRGEAGPGYGIGTPAVADGTVYVAEGEIGSDEVATTTVYALDPADGSVEWSRTYEGSNTAGGIAVADGLVLYRVGDLVALDAATGDERWRYGGDDPSVAGRVTVADGSAYVWRRGYEGTELASIALSGGEERWRVGIEAGQLGVKPPAVADGTVYVGGDDLRAFGTDGEMRWEAGLDHSVEVAPTVADGGVYVAGSGAAVSAVGTDGRTRWTETVEGSSRVVSGGPETVAGSPACDGERLYVQFQGRATALSTDTGEREWETPTLLGNHPAVGGGDVFVPGIDELLCLDAESGREKWSFRTDAGTGGPTQAVPLDGLVLFPSEGLHALVA